jgi:hypothetical protein
MMNKQQKFQIGDFDGETACPECGVIICRVLTGSGSKMPGNK